METSFCIISNNCWGAEVYKDYDLGYNTPFVGLFIPPDCFVKLCNDLTNCLSKQLLFTKDTKYDIYKTLVQERPYPIGLLGDIEIHFLHYGDESEARDKWERRKSRMPKDEQTWLIKGCDREIENWENYVTQWNKIPYKKVFFSAKRRTNINGLIWIMESFRQPCVTDGKALYNISKKYFSITQLMGTGLGQLSGYEMLKAFFKK